MKIIFLPNEFSQLLRLQTKPSFANLARTVREGNKLILRVSIEDFDEDDLLVAFAEDVLVVLGNHYPGSFCLHFPMPPDAVVKEATAQLKEGFLEVEMPVKSSSA